MGTRGFTGFVVGGRLIGSYNHCHSYPSGLGVALAVRLRDELEVGSVESMREGVKRVRLVDDVAAPSPEDVERYWPHADLSLGEERCKRECYALLRNLQGDPFAQLEAGVMTDGTDFPLHSLFCEWAYVVDLDRECLDVYEGFRKVPPTEGHWVGAVTESAGAYWPVQRVDVIPFGSLAGLDIAAHMAALEDVTDGK